MSSSDAPSRVGDLLKQADAGSHATTLKTLGLLDSLEVEWGVRATVHILRNFSAEQLPPQIRLAGYALGCKIDVTLSDFDAYQGDLMDPTSVVQSVKHDVVVLALLADNLRMARARDGQMDEELAWEHLVETAESALKVTTAQVLILSLLRPMDDTYDSANAGVIDRLNGRLASLAAGNSRLSLLPVHDWVSELGASVALDLRYWYLYSAPWKPALVKAIAQHIAQIAGALKGRSRKVLVLDADNTLWGGVIGEEGLDGIALDPASHPGNIFQAVQRQVLSLTGQGVILALCSKNNEEDVLRVLDEHPHCLLGREHLAAWRINWDNKAANLVALAEELNVGLDSIVFMDDNPVECALVRESLPEVEVLELPPKPSGLPSALRTYRGFSSARTDEDLTRSQHYIAERTRRSVRKAAIDLDSFIGSLGIELEVRPCTPATAVRVAQLSQRTNQFNVSGRRYSSGELEQACADQDSLVLTLNARDRFGDYGLSGAAVLRREQDETLIEALFVSCRVLGRKVEAGFVTEVVRMADQTWGERTVIAHFVRSSKNQQVVTFLEQHGFSLLSSQGGTERHRLVDRSLLDLAR